MSESKKRLYKRETCTNALKMFVDKAERVNNGTSDYPYPDKIIDVIVFGSYMDKTKDKIHDLDLCIVVKEHRELWDEWRKKYSRYFSNRDYMYQMFLPYCARNQYLQRGQRVISLHPDDDLEIALGGPHMYVVKDGEVLKENIAELIGEVVTVKEK